VLLPPLSVSYSMNVNSNSGKQDVNNDVMISYKLYSLGIFIYGVRTSM
jgi:hypothetical protein